jgi:hypothetical protein
LKENLSCSLFKNHVERRNSFRFHRTPIFSVSDFFPGNALGRTILNDFIYLFFRVFRQVNHLYIACVVSSEDRGAQLQTCLAVITFTKINDWYLHHPKICSRKSKIITRTYLCLKPFTVSVYRMLQMRGGGYADVLPVLQVPGNKADAVPCERLPLFYDVIIGRQSGLSPFACRYNYLFVRHIRHIPAGKKP